MPILIQHLLVALALPLPVVGALVGCRWIEGVDARGRSRVATLWMWPGIFLCVGSAFVACILGIFIEQNCPELRRSALVGTILALVLAFVGIWRLTTSYTLHLYRKMGVQAESSVLQRWVRLELALLVLMVFLGLVIAALLGAVPLLSDYRGLRVVLGTLLVCTLLSVFLPRWIAWVAGTSEAEDSALIEDFHRLSRRAGVRRLRLRVLEAHESVTGAWIVGLLPGMRTLFLSRGLLARLRHDEVLAIVGHELGHARLHHLPIYVVLALSAFAGSHALAWLLVHEVVPLAIRLLFGTVLFLSIAPLGWLAAMRHFEAQADRFAVSLLGDARPLASALERIATKPPKSAKRRRLLDRLLDTHPTLERRLRDLREMVPPFTAEVSTAERETTKS